MLIFKKILQYRFLSIAILIYFLIVGTVAVLRHYQFQTQAWDMGIFEQTMWNTVNGRVMQNSLEEIPNHLGVHMSPFLFLLVPFYAIFPSPYFLLIIQTAALALAAVPLYFFAKKVFGRERLAKAFVLSYLFNPALHSVSLFDFHASAFFIPLALTAFYFWVERKFVWAGFWLVLAALTQEDAAVMAAAIAGYWLLAALIRREGGKFKFSWGGPSRKSLILLFFLGLYFWLAVKWLMPAWGGGLLRLDRYSHLGGAVGEIIKNLFTNPGLFWATIFTAAKLKYLLFLLLPVALLPLLSLSSIFLLLPGVLENILTNYDTQFSGLYQYDAVVLPGLYIAAVYGASALLKLFGREKIIFYFLLFFSGGAFFYYSLISPWQFPVDLFRRELSAKQYAAIVRLIPTAASVAAPTNLVPHLAHREYIRVLGNEGFWTDIVIIDRFDKFGFGTDEQFQAYFDARVNSGQYKMTIIDDRYIILVKNATPPNLP